MVTKSHYWYEQINQMQFLVRWTSWDPTVLEKRSFAPLRTVRWRLLENYNRNSASSNILENKSLNINCPERQNAVNDMTNLFRISSLL